MENGRIKNSARNILAKLIGQMVTIVLSFISRTVFIDAFGREFLGMNSLFTEIFTWLSMADLGFGVALAYSFYKPIAENNEKQISALITFYRQVYTVVALVVTVLGLSMIPFLDVIINIRQPIDNLILYYILALAGLVSSYLFSYKTVILVADQKEYIITKIDMVVNLLTTVIQIVFLVCFKNYVLYLFINVVSTFSGNLYKVAIANKKYPALRKKAQLTKTEKKHFFENISSIFIYKISGVMINATDNTIISVLLGTAVVGSYANYRLLSGKISGVFTMIFSTLVAGIGNVIVKESAQKRYEIFKCEQFAGLVLCGIVVPCFVALSNDFVNCWLGYEYIIGTNVVVVIGINMYISLSFQALWSYREATGIYQQTKWIMFICAVINIVLSVILGKYMGLSGILLATFISRICTYGWYEPIILFKTYFGEKAISFFKDLIFNFIIVGLLTGLLLWISDIWTVNRWASLIAKGIVFCAISTGVTFAIYRKNEAVGVVKSKAKKLFGEIKKCTHI